MLLMSPFQNFLPLPVIIQATCTLALCVKRAKPMYYNPVLFQSVNKICFKLKKNKKKKKCVKSPQGDKYNRYKFRCTLYIYIYIHSYNIIYICDAQNI